MCPAGACKTTARWWTRAPSPRWSSPAGGEWLRRAIVDPEQRQQLALGEHSLLRAVSTTDRPAFQLLRASFTFDGPGHGRPARRNAQLRPGLRFVMPLVQDVAHVDKRIGGGEDVRARRARRSPARLEATCADGRRCTTPARATVTRAVVDRQRQGHLRAPGRRRRQPRPVVRVWHRDQLRRYLHQGEAWLGSGSPPPSPSTWADPAHVRDLQLGTHAHFIPAAAPAMSS